MNLRDGAVYVRHQASTVEATGADHDMLSRRAAGTRRRISGISLLVAPSCRVVSLDVTEDAVAAWADREREAMKPPPPAQPPKWSAPPGSSLEATALRVAAAVRAVIRSRNRSGEPLSTKAMVDYFQPLLVWLEEQNRGRVIGWD